MLGARRWLLVLVLLAVVGVVEVSSDSLLDAALPFPLDTLVVMTVITFATLVGASVAFRRVDRLASTLQQRNAELEARHRSADALHRVSMALGALPELQAILDAVVDNARRLLDADVALLVLTRADGLAGLQATSGKPGVAGPADFDRSGGGPGSDFRQFVRPELLRSQLAAPLRRGGRTIGTLAVGSLSERDYGVDAIEILASLASQAAIAVENDRLQRELRELAIRGERERIAREMHDGLAQVLGYVNTKSQAVEELLAAGRVDEARSHLAELATAARSVYVDVREAILGLTSPIVPERGLVGALEEYAQRYSEASKLVAVVVADAPARELALPPQVQAQLYRIVQEALTNVRKHAAAQRACVELSIDGDALRITVDDDGRGFDPGASESSAWPHFGVRTMRERAESLGGAFELAPRPDGGTRLRLALPLPRVLETGVS